MTESLNHRRQRWLPMQGPGKPGWFTRTDTADFFRPVNSPISSVPQSSRSSKFTVTP